MKGLMQCQKELQGLTVAAPTVLPAEEQSLSEEQKAANAASVLSALEMFG